MTVGTFQSDAHTRDDGVWVFPRDEFCRDRFTYKPGEHVLFGGPTGRGKTELAFNLLKYCATPELPAYVAVSKPLDPVSSRWGEKLGFRRVESWPPARKFKDINNKPSGYLVWPRFGDVETDNMRAAQVTADLIDHTYANGVRGHHAILVMDDTMVKAKILGLDGKMVTLLAMAGAMGIGVWVFIQKPTDSGRTTLWSYENATHVF